MVLVTNPRHVAAEDAAQLKTKREQVDIIDAYQQLGSYRAVARAQRLQRQDQTSWATLLGSAS
jgi:hypothetical protein